MKIKCEGCKYLQNAYWCDLWHVGFRNGYEMVAFSEKECSRQKRFWAGKLRFLDLLKCFVDLEHGYHNKKALYQKPCTHKNIEELESGHHYCPDCGAYQ